MADISYNQFPTHNGAVLNLETPLYRYLPTAAFIDLLVNEELSFTKVCTWDDGHEGRRIEALKVKPNSKYASRRIDEFYASCWSLQTEDKLLFNGDKDAYQRSVDELAKYGSDAMWRAYCSDGGVRIKTTLGKLKKLLLASSLPTLALYSGQVYYDSDESDWGLTLGSNNCASALFQKRVSFRSEAEFRFVFCANEGVSDTRIPVRITSSLSDFFDEILVSPARASEQWKARVLLRAAYRNAKTVRISALYGDVPIGDLNGH